MVRFFERVSAGSQPIQQPGRRGPKSPSAATPEASIVRRVFGESLPSLPRRRLVPHIALFGNMSAIWSAIQILWSVASGSKVAEGHCPVEDVVSGRGRSVRGATAAALWCCTWSTTAAT